ncbi:MAG: hypothetical protein U0271_16090 [Polyangiaceae bacterium]
MEVPNIGQARLVISVAKRPGDSVSDFILGCTNHIRRRAKKQHRLGAEKLASKVIALTRSLVTLTAGSEEACDGLARLLLRHLFALGFDPTFVRGPNADVLMDLRAGAVASELLAGSFAVLASRLRALPGVVGPTLRSFSTVEKLAASGLPLSEPAAQTLRDFADPWLPDSSPTSKSEKRLVELADYLSRTQQVVLARTDGTCGPDSQALESLHAQAKAGNGLLFDDLAVYGPGDQVVFATWMTRFAALDGLRTAEEAGPGSDGRQTAERKRVVAEPKQVKQRAKARTSAKPTAVKQSKQPRDRRKRAKDAQ